MALRSVFETTAAAVEFVVALMQMGCPVARAEFMDPLALEAVCRYEKLDYARLPTILLEFHANSAPLDSTRVAIDELLQHHGALSVHWASTPAERSALWKARHNVAHAEPLLRPGSKALVTDTCVPLSKLAECISETQADLEDSGLCAPMVGHVGDGNFHLAILIDPASEREAAAAEALHARLIRRALEAGGTASGEHGIGLGKRQFLVAEHGRGAELMWAIKKTIDPDNLMNPGKIFDAGLAGPASILAGLDRPLILGQQADGKNQ